MILHIVSSNFNNFYLIGEYRICLSIEITYKLYKSSMEFTTDCCNDIDSTMLEQF